MIPPSEELSPVQRYHPRVEANLMVKLAVNGRAYVIKARNVSMAGMHLLGYPASPGERITVAIPLPGDREVVTGCEVRRWTQDGIAVEFDQLDWDDLLALARFLHPRLP
jgi:hypothetical protein